MKAFFRTLFLLLLLGLVAAAGIAYDGHQQLQLPLNLSAPTRMQIEPGSRIRSAILDLHDRGVFASARQGIYLEFYARATGKAAGIKAGEYDLAPGLSAYGALEQWIAGKIVQYELRLTEGMRYSEALKLVIAHPELKHTLADTRPEAVMAAIGHAGEHPEGRFFPDTYHFPKNTTDVAFLKRAYAAMEKTLDAEWANRAPELPYATPAEALIMASIVEKETGLASERPQIAGVFVRRLKLGMLLQTDPTVIYGVGENFDGNLRRRDLVTDTPYNTYTRGGLPPTPICLPGRAAINAALHPLPGNTLFFVSRGDGSHQFSATLEEHSAAVRRFQLGQRP